MGKEKYFLSFDRVVWIAARLFTNGIATVLASVETVGEARTLIDAGICIPNAFKLTSLLRFSYRF